MRIPFSPKWLRTWSCLKDAQLAAYIDGTHPAADRLRADKHLAGCGACRDAVAVLLRSESVAGEVPQAWIARARHLGTRPPATAAGWKWATATAVLVVAALGVTAAYRPKPEIEVASAQAAPAVESRAATQPPADQVRTLNAPAVALMIISPTEGQALARNEQVQWEPVSSAMDYDIRILNSAGDTIWKSTTSASHIQFPRKLAATPAEKYFVLISANLPNGKTVRAHAVSFHVRAEQE